MTGRSEVDIDRLADFVGGALDGTPDADQVGHLIESDPQWAAAHSALLAAERAVRADLTAFGQTPADLPASIVARLDAALAAAASGHATSGRAAPDRSARRPSSANGQRSLTGPTAARRRPAAVRRRRWTAVLATAATVLIVGVGGLATLRWATQPTSDTTATSAGGADQNRASAPKTQNLGPGTATGTAAVLVTGFDYTANTLDRLRLRARPSAGAVAGEGNESARSPDLAVTGAPAELAPLTDPAVRGACLNAIVRRYGGVVVVLDYARFNGSPALVVLLDEVPAAGGRTWAVVVGPACGQSDSIIDQRYGGPA